MRSDILKVLPFELHPVRTIAVLYLLPVTRAFINIFLENIPCIDDCLNVILEKYLAFRCPCSMLPQLLSHISIELTVVCVHPAQLVHCLVDLILGELGLVQQSDLVELS